MDAPQNNRRATLSRGIDATLYPLPFKTGGKINIKSENRGKFNATKQATGKTTEQLTHSSDPLTKKRAVFAQNASKFKHADGGTITEPGKGLPAFDPAQFAGPPTTPLGRPDLESRIAAQQPGAGQPDGGLPGAFMQKAGPIAGTLVGAAGEALRRGAGMVKDAWNSLDKGPQIGAGQTGRALPNFGTKLPTRAAGGPIPPQDKYNVRTDTVGLYKNPNRNLTDRELHSAMTGNRNYYYKHPEHKDVADKDLQKIEQVMKYREYQKSLPKKADGGKMFPGSSETQADVDPSGNGMQAPILMYNTYANNIREATAQALKRVTPLPRAEQGMKIYSRNTNLANAQFGDKTFAPKSPRTKLSK